MNKIIAIALSLAVVAGSASAHENNNTAAAVGLGVGALLGASIAAQQPAPVAVPQPVYVQPAPVVVAPQPVYVQPAPQPVYVQPGAQVEYLSAQPVFVRSWFEPSRGLQCGEFYETVVNQFGQPQTILATACNHGGRWARWRR